MAATHSAETLHSLRVSAVSQSGRNTVSKFASSGAPVWLGWLGTPNRSADAGSFDTAPVLPLDTHRRCREHLSA